VTPHLPCLAAAHLPVIPDVKVLTAFSRTRTAGYRWTRNRFRASQRPVHERLYLRGSRFGCADWDVYGLVVTTHRRRDGLGTHRLRAHLSFPYATCTFDTNWYHTLSALHLPRHHYYCTYTPHTLLLPRGTRPHTAFVRRLIPRLPLPDIPYRGQDRCGRCLMDGFPVVDVTTPLLPTEGPVVGHTPPTPLPAGTFHRTYLTPVVHHRTMISRRRLALPHELVTPHLPFCVPTFGSNLRLPCTGSAASIPRQVCSHWSAPCGLHRRFGSPRGSGG